jgi:hypothetical protein
VLNPLLVTTGTGCHASAIDLRPFRVHPSSEPGHDDGQSRTAAAQNQGQQMDPAIVPLVLVALVAAMYSTWQELRASLQPGTCTECPHCRDLVAQRKHAAVEDARRQAELRTWYARRHGADDEDDKRR